MTRRLLFSYLTITVFVLLILEVPLALTYANSERDRLTADVERDAAVLATRVEGTLAGRVQDDVQQLADEYEATVGGRVVIVDPTGTSVADSGADTPQDFSTRPEFADVLRTGDRASGTPPLRHARRVAVVRRRSRRVVGRAPRRSPDHLSHDRDRRTGPALLAVPRRARRRRAPRRGRRRFRPRPFRHGTRP